MQTKYCLLALILTLSAGASAEKEAVGVEKEAVSTENEEPADHQEDGKRLTRQTKDERNFNGNEEDVEEDGLIGKWRSNGQALEPKWRDGDTVPLLPFSHYSRTHPVEIVIKPSKDRLTHLRSKVERTRASVYRDDLPHRRRDYLEDRMRSRDKDKTSENREEAEKAKSETRHRSRGRFDFDKFEISGAAGYREAFQARANEYEQELNDEEYLKPRPRKRRPPQNYEFILAANEASSRKAETIENAKNHQPNRPWNSRTNSGLSNSGKADGNRFDKAIELKSLLKMQQEEGLSLSEVLQRKNLTLHDLLNGKPDVITALKNKDAEEFEEVMEQASRAMSNSLKKLLVTDRPHSTTNQPKIYEVDNRVNINNGRPADDSGLSWSRETEPKFIPTTAMTLLSTAVVGIQMTERTEFYTESNETRDVRAETLIPRKDENDTLSLNDTVRYVLYSEIKEPSQNIKIIKMVSTTTPKPSTSSPPLITSTENFPTEDFNESGEINMGTENSDEDEIMEFSDFRDYPKTKIANPETIVINAESTSGYIETARNRPETGSTLSIEQILSPTSRTTFERANETQTREENHPTESNSFPEYVDDTPQVQDDVGYSSEELGAVRFTVNVVKPKESGTYVNGGVTTTDKINDENDPSGGSYGDESLSNNPHEMYEDTAIYEDTPLKDERTEDSREKSQPSESPDSLNKEQDDPSTPFYSYDERKDEPPKNTLIYNNYQEQSNEPMTSTTVRNMDNLREQDTTLKNTYLQNDSQEQRDEPLSNTSQQEQLPQNHRIQPKVRRYEDIVSEIEPEARAEIFELFASGSSAKRLERILKSRNMSLDELIALRQRGSSSVHLAEVSKLREQRPRILQEDVGDSQFISSENTERTEDAFGNREYRDENIATKNEMAERLPTFTSLPFEDTSDQHKISLKDSLQMDVSSNLEKIMTSQNLGLSDYDDGRTNSDNQDRNLNITSQSSTIGTNFHELTTTNVYSTDTEKQSTKPREDQSSSLRPTDPLPTFASLPFDKEILSIPDEKTETFPENEFLPTLSINETENVNRSSNAIHGHVEQIPKKDQNEDKNQKILKSDDNNGEETRKTLSRVRPSIIASGAILGVTIVVFLAILIACRIRQKQKYTYRNTFSRAVFQGPMMAARKLSNSSSLSTVMVNVVATSTTKRPDRHEPANADEFGPTSDIDNDSLDANDSWETIPDYMK